jgi:hypothetical protein
VQATNTSGDTINFYNDYTVKNIKTGKQKKWSCKSLTQTTNLTADTSRLTADQEKSIQRIIGQDARYVKELPINAQVGQYEEVDLNLLDGTNFPEKGKYKIFRKKGEFQQVSDAAQIYINKLTEAGWTSIACNDAQADPDLYAEVVNLKTKYPNVFNSDYCMAMKIDTTFKLGDFNQYLTDNYDVIKTNQFNPDRKMCRNLINQYWDAMSQGKRVTNREQLPIVKNYIKQCNKDFKFNFGTKNNLERIIVSNKTRYGEYGLNESLSKIVKNSLLEVKERKKDLVVERQIVKNRYNLLTEHISNNEISEENLFYLVMNEMVKLRKLNLTESVLNEEEKGFISTLTSMFGGGIVDMFQERLAKYFLENMFGPDMANSVLGNMLQTAFGNVELKDIPKFFSDCNFTSKWIVESVIEGIVKRYQDKADKGGFVGDTIRNTIIDAIRSTEVVDGLANKLTGVVCKYVGNLSDKADSAFAGLKQKVVQS